jgi:hypothetical protein
MTEYISRQQTTGTNLSERPNLQPCKIKHVDVLAWICRLRVAPSRTSPISAIRNQNRAFAPSAAHTHPTRHIIISARKVGTSRSKIYPAVTDPSMKPISSLGHGWRPGPPCCRFYKDPLTPILRKLYHKIRLIKRH